MSSSQSHVSGNRIQAEAERTTHVLLQQLADPNKLSALKNSRSMTRVSRYNLARLKFLQKQTGLRSNDSALSLLFESVQQDNMTVPASLKIIYATDQPVQLCGGSGTGKSLFLKTILPRIPSPILLIDPHDEHTGFKRLTIGDFFELKWAKADPTNRVKFVPSSNLDVSRGELRTIFSHLNMIKLEDHRANVFPSGLLGTWTIVCEESHRLSREPAFREFASEGRKFVRKILLVASDPALFGSICRLMKPPPLDGLLEDTRKAESLNRQLLNDWKAGPGPEFLGEEAAD